MLRWPTSELPICPRAGRRRARRRRSSCAGTSCHRRSQFGFAGTGDRVVGRILAAADAVEDQQHDRDAPAADAERAGCVLIGDDSRSRLRSEGLRYHFTFIPSFRRRDRPRHPMPISVHPDQLDADPDPAPVRSDAGLAAVQRPPVRDARTSATCGHPAHQRQERRAPRCARDRRNTKPAASAQRRSTSRCRSSRAAAQELAKLAARPLIVYCDRGNRSRGVGADAGQAGLQGSLYAARRLSRLEGRGVAGGAGTLMAADHDVLDRDAARSASRRSACCAPRALPISPRSGSISIRRGAATMMRADRPAHGAADLHRRAPRRRLRRPGRPRPRRRAA